MLKNNVADLEENEVDVPVKEFCERLNLTVVHKSRNRKIHVATFHVSRPGLQLVGFYEHFSAERVQVMGEQETAFLSKMSHDERVKALEGLFAYDFPCLVLTKAEKLPEIIETARKFDRLVLESPLRTTAFINELSIYLNEILAPTTTIHGVLTDMYGVGVLIIGKSGVGKSETALELVQRGHRIVADDAVKVSRISDQLVGTAPSNTAHFAEIRGIGIINIQMMYGAGAIRNSKTIDLVVKLEDWDEKKNYDRLGNEESFYTIHKTQVPLYTIPVKPGRNLACILEIAARNYRLKSMGYSAFDELTRRISAVNSEED
jgi:HPr kinase/phosphorylase